MADKIAAAGGKEDKGAAAQEKMSGTAYPYFDLRTSIEVAEAIHVKGGGICDIDQLAAWLNYKSTASGTFASRLASARYFGLIGNTKGGKVGITDRARAILAPVMPTDATNARVDAFLGVDLYRRLFDKFRGQQLPPDVGLGNLFQHEFKILSERVQQAVRVFKDSATQAGFFQSAPDRLIRPSSASATPPADAVLPPANPAAAPPPPDDPPRRRGGGGDDGSGIDPAILGLLRRLPQPGVGWTKDEQTDFLSAFTAFVKFVYPAKSEAGGA